MKIGLSLSPGGLLLPYHMGVLHHLQQERVIDPSTLVAGSSAGSIAAMAHGCGIHPYQVLEGTVDISETCQRRYNGRTHGKLLSQLERHMERLVGQNEWEYFQQHSNIGIAYTQVFPRPQSHLQTKFQSRDDLFRAVKYSCMFPFFTTDSPWLVDSTIYDDDDDAAVVAVEFADYRIQLPRLMMDGVFSVPWDRFGCPILDDIKLSSSDLSYRVDRTIAVSVLPQHVLKWCGNGMGHFPKEDCISPSVGGHQSNHDVMIPLLRLAVMPSSRKELTQLFELGERDAELWCRQEEQRQRQKENRKRQQQRILQMRAAALAKRALA
jgi:hypothetical protein